MHHLRAQRAGRLDGFAYSGSLLQAYEEPEAAGDNLGTEKKVRATWVRLVRVDEGDKGNGYEGGLRTCDLEG